MSDRSWTSGWTLGDWAVALLAAIIAIFGILITGGGLWLLALGGSWYYVIAGIGLLVTAWFLFRRELTALWVYLATFAFTVVWALWERGFDGWAQVPRLVAPTLILVLVLLCLPVLRRRGRRLAAAPLATAAGLVVVIGASLGGYGLLHSQPVTAQEASSSLPSTLPSPSSSEPAAVPASALPSSSALAAPSASAAPASAPMSSTPLPASSASVAPPAPAVPAPAEAPQPALVATAAALPATGDDWPAFGGTYEAQRYSPLDEITPDNVGKLKQVWTFNTGDLPDDKTKGEYSPETTPIKVGDSMYLCSAKNIIMALDAATGKERWEYDPTVPDDAIPYGATCRGVVYYAVPSASADDLCSTRIIEGTLDARLVAVDAKTGLPCPKFGNSGNVDLSAGIGRTVPGWYGNVAAPVIVRGVIVMGAQVQDGQAEDAPSGVIRGYDAVTGALKWAWDMCKPELTGAPPAGETYTRGTPNMWTSAAADEALGMVYIPLGNSAVDYYGGNRLDCENEYNSSLVALDATTGKEAWHFQTVHYDVWDYDLGSQPTLVDFPADSGTVPAVILPSKQGQLYVLDRRTGDSLFPVEERPVPTGGVEADRLSKTQPYSGYANVTQPDLTEADMWGMTPLDQLWCRIQFRMTTYDGQYTAPTLDHRYIEYPGYNGGSDWGSVAVDANRGVLVVNYNDMPNYNQLITREEAIAKGIYPIDVPHPKAGKSENEFGPQAGSPYAIEDNPGWRESTGLLCKQPPYGGIRAIDLKTGKTLWDEPLGQARENGPWGIKSMLPIPIGTPNNGGTLVTKSGLIFIAAATDNLIRAIDIKTGKVLWTYELPAGGQANPMAFTANGHEYIAVMAGGHHFMETPVGDAFVAFRLPDKS